jgi:hypothetical protein
MKLLVDIGHPAHVHYFKNAILQLKDKGHEVIVSARNRPHVADLLKHYGITFIDRGKGRDSFFGKLWYMLKADWQLLRVSIHEKPDLYLSFSSPYAAQVAFLRGKPHICLNDTEHTDQSHAIFTYPFSSVIITPFCYQHDLGEKQVRMNNIIEGLYLDKSRFTPDPTIAERLKGPNDQPYVIVRFVSWKAHHDFGQSGMSDDTKYDLIKILQTKFRVHISAEGDIPEEIGHLSIDIPSVKMHDALAGAGLFVGESGTMASESAFLGVYSIYVNSLPLMGYLKFEEDNGLLRHFTNSTGVVEHVQEFLNKPILTQSARIQSERMKEGFENANQLLVSTVESYLQKQNQVGFGLPDNEP